MDEIEQAIKTISETLLASPSTIVLIGPWWRYVVHEMTHPLIQALGKEVETFRWDIGKGTLRNGSRIFSLSSQSGSVYMLQGLLIDQAWVHGSLSEDMRYHLLSRLLNREEEGRIIRTYG